MSGADEGKAETPPESVQLRQSGPGLLRYMEENPLAAIAGVVIAAVILARFAFLGNPKD